MFMNQVRLLVKKSCSFQRAGWKLWEANIAVSSPRPAKKFLNKFSQAQKSFLDEKFILSFKSDLYCILFSHFLVSFKKVSLEQLSGFQSN